MTLIVLILVAGLNIAASYQATPPKSPKAQGKIKIKRKNNETQEPTVSYGYTSKRIRRQWPSPQDDLQNQDIER